MALFLQTADQFLRPALVAWLGSADKVIISDVHPLKKLAEERRDLVGELFGRLARGGGGALNLLPMLVCAGEEISVIP